MKKTVQEKNITILQKSFEKLLQFVLNCGKIINVGSRKQGFETPVRPYKIRIKEE